MTDEKKRTNGQVMVAKLTMVKDGKYKRSRAVVRVDGELLRILYYEDDDRDDTPVPEKV